MGNGVLSRADYDELRDFDLFSNFSNDELSRLLRGAVRRTCRRGMVLFVQGDRADRFFLVLSGRVKLIQRLENGDESLVEIFRTGQSFGEAAMLTARPFPVGGEVLADCRLVQVAAEPFLAELARVPALAFKVLANLARLHRRLLQQLAELRFKSPRQRFVAYLLTLTSVTEGQAVVRLPEDKNVIASRIGISAESLSRLLIRLRKSGVQCRGREIVLENVQDLHIFCVQKYAQTDSSCRAIRYCAARAQRLKQSDFSSSSSPSTGQCTYYL